MKHLAIVTVIAVGSGASAYGQSDAISHREDPVTPLRDAYAQGRNADVVLLADRAIVKGAGGGEVHFWRAAALRRLDRLDEALVALDASSQAGFDAPEVHLERALALSALGRSKEAERSMEEVRRMLQDDARRREFESRWSGRPAAAKRFDFSVRPQFGYDSNLVTIQDDASLVEASDRKSLFYGAQLSGKAHLLESRAHALDVEYRGNFRAYTSESDLSSTDDVLSLVGRTPLSATVDMEVRLAYGEVWLAGEGHFRTERSVLPAMLYRPAEDWELRLRIEWSDADFYENVPAEQDRDGTRQGARVEATWNVGGGWSLTPVLAFRVLGTEGSDYDGKEREVGLRVGAPEMFGIQPLLVLGYVDAPFDHPHSLTGFTEPRKDGRTVLGLTVTFPALEKLAGFVPSATVRYEHWQSNIAEFDFTRWEPVVEFAVNLPF